MLWKPATTDSFFKEPRMMNIPKQEISNMELELYLGHLSAKAALFG